MGAYFWTVCYFVYSLAGTKKVIKSIENSKLISTTFQDEVVSAPLGVEPRMSTFIFDDLIH